MIDILKKAPGSLGLIAAGCGCIALDAWLLNHPMNKQCAPIAIGSYHDQHHNHQLVFIPIKNSERRTRKHEINQTLQQFIFIFYLYILLAVVKSVGLPFIKRGIQFAP